jgi:hypothetical protein
MQFALALLMVCLSPSLAWGDALHLLVTRENHKPEELPFALTATAHGDIIDVRVRVLKKARLEEMTEMRVVLREGNVETGGVVQLWAPLATFEDKQDKQARLAGFRVARKHAQICEVELYCPHRPSTGVVTYCVKIEGWLPRETPPK